MCIWLYSIAFVLVLAKLARLLSFLLLSLLSSSSGRSCLIFHHSFGSRVGWGWYDVRPWRGSRMTERKRRPRASNEWGCGFCGSSIQQKRNVLILTSTCGSAAFLEAGAKWTCSKGMARGGGMTCKTTNQLCFQCGERVFKETLYLVWNKVHRESSRFFLLWDLSNRPTDKGVGQPLCSRFCGWILYQQGELQKPNQVDIFGQPSLEVCLKEEHDASYFSTMTSVKLICCQQPLPIAVNLFSLTNIFVLVQAPAGTCIGSSTI